MRQATLVGAVCVLAFGCGIENTQNTPPNAEFQISPSSGTTSTVFTFNASYSWDANEDTTSLEVRWDFEGDGVWDTGYSRNKVTQHQYSANGSMEPRLSVKDSGGLTDIAEEYLLISAPPVASFTVQPPSGDINTTFTVDASGCTDPDDSPEYLDVRWDWENDGTWDTSYSSMKTAIHEYSTTGMKTIKLEVKDLAGSTATTTRQVTVTGINTAPMASFTVTPGSGDTNTDFAVNASSSWDSEDPASSLQVRWDWENDGSWDTTYSTTKTASHRYTTTGWKTIKLEVRDTGGLTDTAIDLVEVTTGGPVETKIRVQNDSSYTIDKVYIADYLDPDWGPDQLSGYIYPGGSHEFDILPGTWDIMVIDTDMGSWTNYGSGQWLILMLGETVVFTVTDTGWSISYQ